MASSSQQRTKVFICFSHHDRQSAERLRLHLRAVIHQGSEVVWDESTLLAGANWQHEIESAIQTAKVAILLVSPDFLASDYLVKNELAPLLQAAEAGSVHIVPVLLRPSLVNITRLARYQFFNDPARPLSSMTPEEQEQVWVQLAQVVKDTLTRGAPGQRCPYCGVEARPGAQFCLNCGNRLGGGQPSAGSSPAAWSTSGVNDSPTMITSGATGWSGSSPPPPQYPGPPTGAYQPPSYPTTGPTQFSPPPTSPPPGRGRRGILGGVIEGIKDALTTRRASRRDLDSVLMSREHQVENSGAQQPPTQVPTTTNLPGSSPTGISSLPTSGQTVLGQRASSREPPPPPEPPRFTAFYPKEVAVETWNTLLVYAHVASALERVRADALRVHPELADNRREGSVPASVPVARGADLTITPRCQGITFNPPSISFKWLRDMHRAEFDFLVEQAYAGGAGNGEITIWAGPLIIGTIKLALLFEELPSPKRDPAPSPETPGTLYQQIFASYSHKDTPVVLACRNTYKALGWEVLIDIDTLRSGQVWSDELLRMIDRSDIFQLFWSEQAAKSDYVRQEWEYALTRQPKKPSRFIRPVYWELPLVEPPAPLSKLHFAYQPLPRLDVPLSVYDQAIQTDPANPIAYQAKADALVEQMRYGDALALYDRAISLAPRYARAYSNKGNALYALGRYEEALAALDQAIAINPMNALAYTRKVAALAKLRRYEEALKASDQAIALNPDDASGSINKGTTLLNLGRYEEAREAYQQAIQISPNFGMTYRNLGVVLERLGQKAEASQAYQRARELGDKW